jgi:hypothetical protein
MAKPFQIISVDPQPSKVIRRVNEDKGRYIVVADTLQ